MTILHIVIRIGFLLAAGALVGAVAYHYRFFLRIIKRIWHRFYPSPLPTWKIAMSIDHPNIGRPRFLSLHTIAAITGRTDLSKILKEMKQSCEVGAQFCSTVKSPVFYLFTKHAHDDKIAWKRAKEFIKKYPFPAYKGFQSVNGYWTGFYYGVGSYVQPDANASPEPFIVSDYGYANLMIKALRDAGHKAGISEYKIDIAD